MIVVWFSIAVEHSKVPLGATVTAHNRCHRRPFSFAYLTLIVRPAGNSAPLTWTAALDGPEDGVMVNIATVNSAVPWIPVPGSVASICACPTPTPVASPCEPEVLEMMATVVSDEDQVTLLVRFWVLWSE
jgi:hypothetical protein